jgi:N6-adenosine-specific RNA methylase IME4
MPINLQAPLTRPIDEIVVGEPALALYDHACAALVAAKSVDEAKQILDASVAMRAYAKQAKNRDLEADAVELRMRATRRLDELRLATGGEHGGRKRKDGSRADPSFVRATLSSQGIDKHLAHQGRILGALSDAKFETVVTDARDKVSRAVRNAVREVEIEQERLAYTARTEQGCTVDDLEALAVRGFRAGVICPDFPWPFEVYSGKGKQRSADRHYDTWPIERIMGMAPLIKKLATDGSVFMPWAVWPNLPAAVELITACGFEFKGLGFLWLKTTKNAEVITLDGDGLHTGMGYATRANTKPVLLGIKGEPLRLSKDVHQVVIAPVGEHSAKPDAVYDRIRRLYPGPYLELFARKPREHWAVWGDEIPRGQMTLSAAAAPDADELEIPESLRRVSGDKRDPAPGRMPGNMEVNNV